MVVSKGREMRGVVVGRNPGQSPGSHTRDSSQRDTARLLRFLKGIKQYRKILLPLLLGLALARAVPAGLHPRKRAPL